MSDANVREIGRVVDMDQSVVVVGVDYDTVSLTTPGWAAGGVRIDADKMVDLLMLLTQAIIAVQNRDRDA